MHEKEVVKTQISKKITPLIEKLIEEHNGLFILQKLTLKCRLDCLLGVIEMVNILMSHYI